MTEKIIAEAELSLETLDLMDFLDKHVGENNAIVSCPIYSHGGYITKVKLLQDEDGDYSLDLS